jgi:sterol desaturase/sphingolipid hydroxylase (fatty acid hydroxylase superfamily)
MSAWNWRLLTLLTPSLLLLVHAVSYGITVATLALIMAGVLLWTLVEYVLHQLAHLIPALQMDHWLHHDNPRDPSGPSKVVSTSIVLLTLVLSIGFFGAFVATGVLIGFFGGYAAFSLIHFAVHQFTIAPGHWLYALKMAHVAHHKLDDVNFGVTTLLWDRVFGTRKA